MKITLDFKLNGKAQNVSADSERSLLEVLREDLSLTGTKYGCGEGQCRACTVLVDGVPTQSCLLPIEGVKGKNVETIESLATGEKLHPVQEAFLSEGAMQCGYCIPGMIMTTVALLRKTPNPTNQQIISNLNGNLCRCCGYPNILKAIERAGGKK